MTNELPSKLQDHILRHPPLFHTLCRRRSSKGKSLDRLLYLSADGVLLVFTADGVGKREMLLAELHSAFVQGPRADGTGSVVFWFQNGKDLAIDFLPQGENGERLTLFVNKLKSLLSTMGSPVLVSLLKDDAPVAAFCTHLSDGYPGHGVLRDNPAEPPLVSSDPLSNPADTDTSFTVSTPISPKRVSALKSPSNMNAFSSSPLTHAASPADEDEDLLSVYLTGEEFLMKWENRQMQERLAWMSDYTQRSLREKTFEAQQAQQIALQRHAAVAQLDKCVAAICRRQLQRRQQHREREREAAVLAAVRSSKRRQHPEDIFVIPSMVKWMSPAARRSATPFAALNDADPLRLFSDESQFLPAAVERSAILPDSHGRLTTLGQPLLRCYDSHVSDLL
jgi:hypothetical protein